MEKQLFMSLGLHLLTEQQLYILLCSITYVEMIIMLLIMWMKKYFIEKMDIIYLGVAIQFIAYALFKVEHVTFFFSLIYLNLFLLLIFLVVRQYIIGINDK